MARSNSAAKGTTLHWHDGTTCHGADTLQECLREAVANCWIGKVLEKEDDGPRGRQKCYSFIVGQFDHWVKHGKFVAETFVATRVL